MGLLAAFLGSHEYLVGSHLDVGGNPQDLLEALVLVEVLGESETGAGDRRQRFAPAHEVVKESWSWPSVTAFTLLLVSAARPEGRKVVPMG